MWKMIWILDIFVGKFLVFKTPSFHEAESITFLIGMKPISLTENR
jgi:hypothetical protein